MKIIYFLLKVFTIFLFGVLCFQLGGIRERWSFEPVVIKIVEPSSQNRTYMYNVHMLKSCLLELKQIKESHDGTTTTRAR